MLGRSFATHTQSDLSIYLSVCVCKIPEKYDGVLTFTIMTKYNKYTHVFSPIGYRPTNSLIF